MSRVNPELLKSAGVAALGSFLFGFDTAVISGTTDALRLRFRSPKRPARLHGGERAARDHPGLRGRGLARGARAAGRCCAALAVLYFVSAVGCALAWDWWSLVVFRFVGGLAIGGSSVVAPHVHRGDLAPGRARTAGGPQPVQRGGGILVAYLSNYFIAGERGRPGVRRPGG